MRTVEGMDACRGPRRSRGIGLASIGLASIGLLGGLAVAGEVSGVTAIEETSVHRPDRLIERRSCADGGAGGIGQAAIVGVARTALLRLDDRGRVVAAWSNTGCAPRPTDEVFVERPDGTIEPASGAVVLDHRWSGDFTDPGVFVAQRLDP